jgi:hypothetical protein
MKPTEAMKKAAQRGLDLRREYGRGGTEVGIARARDITNGVNLSPETITRMKAFFNRHEQNRDSEKRESDGGPTNGWIAWLLWGGDAGRSWANARVSEMNEFYDFGPINLSEADAIERQIFAWGDVEHPTGKFKVDEVFAKEMIASFKAFTEDGYFPPVLFEHKSEGTIKGLVRGLRVTSTGINAVMELAEGVKALADKDELHYLSPSFAPKFKHPHTGDTLKFALREVSFVSVPHLKNLKTDSTHYALKEAKIMADELKEETNVETTPPVENAEEKPDFAKALADLEKRFTAKFSAFEKGLKQLMEHGKEEEPKENSEADPRTAKLEKEVQRLQRTLAEREIVTALGETDDDTIAELVELKEVNEALFIRTLNRLAPESAPPVQNSEKGFVGAPPVRTSYEKAVELGEAKGIKNGSAEMVEYLAKDHPHVMV